MLSLKIIKHVLFLWIHSSLLKNNILLNIKLIECVKLECTQPYNSLPSFIESVPKTNWISKMTKKSMEIILKKGNEIPEYNFDEFREFICTQMEFNTRLGQYFGSKFDDQLYKYAYIVFLFVQKRYSEFESETKEHIKGLLEIYKEAHEKNINPDQDIYTHCHNLFKPSEFFQNLIYFFIQAIHASFECDCETFRILFEPFISVLENSINIILTIEKKKKSKANIFSKFLEIYEEIILENDLNLSKEQIETMQKLMDRIYLYVKHRLDEIIKEKGDYCLVEISHTIAETSQKFKKDLLHFCQQKGFEVFHKEISRIFYLCKKATTFPQGFFTIETRNNKLELFLNAYKSEKEIKTLENYLTIRKTELPFIRSIYLYVGIERAQTETRYCNLGVSLIFKIILKYFEDDLYCFAQFLKMHLVNKWNEKNPECENNILKNAEIENVNFKNYIYNKNIFNFYNEYFNLVCEQLQNIKIEEIKKKIKNPEKYSIDAFIEDVLPGFFSLEEKKCVCRSLFTVVFDNLNLIPSDRHDLGRFFVQEEIVNNNFFQVRNSNDKGIRCKRCNILKVCSDCECCIKCCICDSDSDRSGDSG